MKLFYAIIVFFLFVHTLTAQNYLDYYHFCNNADEAIALKEYDTALDYFEKGFQDVPYVHARNYEKATKCALLLGDSDQAKMYMEKAILNGSQVDFLDQKWLKKNELHVPDIDVDVLREVHLNTLNKSYIQLIDSLNWVDQYIIRNNKRYEKGKYLIKENALPENKYDLDQRNIDLLFHWIDSVGFPSEQLVGQIAYNQVRTLMLHNLRLPQNITYLNLAREAVMKGNYLPHDYADVYWQYSQNTNVPTLYSTFDKNVSPDNLARLDRNRKEIGLKPLRAYKIKGKGLRLSTEWGRF